MGQCACADHERQSVTSSRWSKVGKGWGCRQALGHLHGGRTFGSPSENPMLVIDLIACLVSVLLPIWNEKVRTRVSSQKMIIPGKSHKLISLLQHSGISPISYAH